MLEGSLVHSPEYSPPQWGPGVWEDEGAEQPFLEFNLGPPPELGPDVDCSLQELASSVREDSRSNSSPEPPAEEYKRCITWWGQALNMPGLMAGVGRDSRSRQLPGTGLDNTGLFLAPLADEQAA